MTKLDLSGDYDEYLQAGPRTKAEMLAQVGLLQTFSENDSFRAFSRDTTRLKLRLASIVHDEA